MRGLSIRLKIVLSFLIFLTVLVCLHAFIFVPIFEASQLSRELTAQMVLTTQLADRLDKSLKDAMRELESVAKLPELQSMKKELADGEIRKINSLTQLYNYYYVLDTTGRWLSFPTQEQFVQKKIPDQNRAWVESVLKKDKTVFVGVLVSLINTVVSGFATPIKNTEGTTVGLLRGVIALSDENYLLKSIKSVFLSGKGYVFLVSSSGKLLAHPDIPLTLDNYNSSDMTAFTPVQKVMAGEKGTERYKWKNEYWYASYSPIETSGWGVIVQQPEEELLAIVGQYSRMLIWFFIVAFFVGAIMVFFIFGYTLRPLSVLVKSIQEGKFDASAQYPKNDIGKLALEFNKMYHDLFDSKEQLRREREKYRILVENQTDLVIKVDHEGRFLFVSPSFCRLFGYIESDTIGRSIFEYTREEDRPTLLNQIRNLSEDFTTHYMTMRTRTREGIKWLEWLTTPVRDASGKIEAFISTGRDITLRMKTEEALAESEGKFQDLAEQSPNMIFINKMGRVVYVNKLSEELLGFSKEEMYDPSFDFYTIIAPESIPLVEEKFKQHLQGIEVQAYEYSIVSKSGKKIGAINTTKLIRYEGGNAILGIVTDISDRKKTEKALKESEEQYRLVVENANDGIVITMEDRLAFANRKFREMIGSTIDELHASSIGDHVHPEDKETVIGKLRGRIKEEAELLPFSCRLATKAGDTLWAEINTVQIVWNGNPALLSFIRNITIQKNLEYELIQAEKMKSIGALAGGIAHDFNNKLQLLGANCYLLLMKRKPGDEDFDELSQMKDTTEKAGELVKQLLSISKRLRSTLVPVDINTIVGKLLVVLEKNFPKSILLTLNPGTDLWAVDADASQLEQVIINLAFNSRDAMPDGGKIIISTENTYLSKDFAEAHIGVQPGKHVRLIFTDTGCGMDDRTLAHIFEPTFTTKGDKKGFGLGLAMVYNILTNHASSVFCRSTVGAGTTFEIYFPVAKTQTESGLLHDKPTDIHGGTETLLIIDDEEDILSLAIKILPRHGYTVHTAKTGEDALAIYTRDPKKIDIVLIDLLMPGMDGLSCLRKIFELNPGAKVMMMSGEPIEHVLDETLKQKLSNVLYKPFDFSELLEKIRLALDGHP